MAHLFSQNKLELVPKSAGDHGIVLLPTTQDGVLMAGKNPAWIYLTYEDTAEIAGQFERMRKYVTAHPDEATPTTRHGETVFQKTSQIPLEKIFSHDPVQ